MTSQETSSVWQAMAVSQVAEVNPREPLPSQGVNNIAVPLYDMAAIDESTGLLQAPTMVPLGTCRSGKTKFRDGDVLFAKITPCVQNGKSAIASGIAGGLAFGSSEFYVLRTGPQMLPEFLFFFIRQKSVIQTAVDSFSGSSGRQRVPSAFWERLVIPVPPLPVQERIVQIFQKADDIGRKRQEALEIGDSILPASFIAMFGDPSRNHSSFERMPLGDLAAVRSGVTKGRKLQDRETVEVPYLRVANVQDGYLDLSEIKTVEVLPEDVDRYSLEDGDILMTEGGDPDKLGRGTVWRNQADGCIYQNHVFRVRTNREKLAPEYLAALLRTQYAKDYFLSCAKRSSNLASVNATQVRAFPVPLPPIKLQEKFVSAVEQWVQISDRLTPGLRSAEQLLAGIMDEAFSGQLTAEWEAANAEWIAEQSNVYNRLPQLAILAILCSKGQAVPVAQLTVYAFLVQTEGVSRVRLYTFVPSRNGPSAHEIQFELNSLTEQGLVEMSGRDGGMIEAEIGDRNKVAEVLASLPEELQEDIEAILATYGDLSPDALLDTVGEKYPIYKTKGRMA